ncbi:hypothetical protein HDF16_005241 [Granulicella aggregans]|uniref:Uncharacterized protein n=1 Tax=Granulicella aggregans TaxID=474949 RepID=A0A7W7ZIE8_9BACT|nr:hypothetical protein [Granulicella aggregans]
MHTEEDRGGNDDLSLSVGSLIMGVAKALVDLAYRVEVEIVARRPAQS